MKLAENLKSDIVLTGGMTSLERIEKSLNRLEVHNRFFVEIIYFGLHHDRLEEAIKFLEGLAKCGDLSGHRHSISLADYLAFRDQSKVLIS